MLIYVPYLCFFSGDLYSLQIQSPINDALFNPPLQSTHLEGVGRVAIEINISSNSKAFNGYNLFVLQQYKQNNTTVSNSSLIITDMSGEIIIEKPIEFNESIIYSSTEFINSTTIMFGKTDRIVLWNIYTNNIKEINFPGRHEIEYNPNRNTFFTFSGYIVDIDGVSYLFDYILEYNITGDVIWSLDTGSFISQEFLCPYYDMYLDFVDVVHSNTLFYDSEEDIFYYNARNINTFYKIDHNSSKIIWGLGEYGNFTLFDFEGNQRDELFYHPHSVEYIDEDTFILFDNDLHNQTNPSNRRSRILEITINEATMTANESWMWIAPEEYFSIIWGDADRLPNGNRLGAFGTFSHFVDTMIGARLVEVDNQGQIVWEMNFPHSSEFIYGVYCAERFRFSPVLSSPPDIIAGNEDEVTVTWQSWYNFRSKRRINGLFTLYLDCDPIESGVHTYDKFWRQTNLTFNLGRFSVGNYNLTIALADEAGHITTDSINISVISSDITAFTTSLKTTTIVTRTFGIGILISSFVLLFLATAKRLQRK
jgi:hypothetical protein